MKIDEILSTLTLEEKVSLLFGKGMWEIAGVRDIPDVVMVDDLMVFGNQLILILPEYLRGIM